ncbi:MAG TPA: UDP-N-acetylmuramoyl-L-alanyl-D-glutamate--2,6-diaminopimelate ligase, partial [Flavobacteriales bacterium]|nr:UDP-N-acetylmuramoyl-L-alanyl-D-glutamate--2,6-diaminopimelate ligase [Flavobacteriales bacterium]
MRILEVEGSTNIAVEGITLDSRKVRPNWMFVAIKGLQSDGHDFINKAIELGADCIICEQIPSERHPHVTYVRVNDAAASLGVMAAEFYDHPSEKLKLIGVTGTNGKTTTVTLLYSLFKRMGYKTGLLSTVVNRIHNETVTATHTTPNAIELNALLREMVDAGCMYCFMEVSSHAVHQKRIAGVRFAGAVFTNITHDHLDYHGTFDEYLKAKKGFFDMLSADAFALVNKDDYHGEE